MIENTRMDKQRMLLKPEAILKFIISDNDELDTLIMCKSCEIDLVTTDKAVYEAIGSVRDDDDFKFNKLRKFFEVVQIRPMRKDILTDERVEKIRKIAFKKGDE